MAKPTTWTVGTVGQKGDIAVKFQDIPVVPPPVIPPPPSSVPPGYQVVFFRSVSVPLNEIERHFITVENDGPAQMKVWIDSEFNPEAGGVVPDAILLKGQSGTFSVARLMLVRPAGPISVKGSYVISWCCPQPRPVGDVLVQRKHDTGVS